MSYSGRCVIGSVILFVIVAVGIGIIIGYFAIKKTDSCPSPETKGSQPSQNYRARCEQDLNIAQTCKAPTPRHYIVTRKKGNLSVDGRLDDQAWASVPWTEDFVDIRGGPPAFPAPSKETRVKIVYDDTQIYVATRLAEDHVWATYTQKDSRIYQENAFEIFFDVDNSMSWYKEYEINALGTTWDLALSRAYMDGGNFFNWEGITQKGVYADGGVNNISNPSTFWSTEVSFSFTGLNENTSRTHITPTNGEVWFVVFARPEYQTQENKTTGKYEQVPGTDASWWSWNPTGAVNLHLPSRWGLLYFTNRSADSFDVNNFQFDFPDWNIYYGLFHIFETMKAFQAVNNMFVTDEKLVHFSPFVHDCFSLMSVQLTMEGFEAKLGRPQSSRVGHINQNRIVWFT